MMQGLIIQKIKKMKNNKNILIILFYIICIGCYNDENKNADKQQKNNFYLQNFLLHKKNFEDLNSLLCVKYPKTNNIENIILTKSNKDKINQYYIYDSSISSIISFLKLKEIIIEYNSYNNFVIEEITYSFENIYSYEKGYIKFSFENISDTTTYISSNYYSKILNNHWILEIDKSFP
jgi:hypothetical protein